MNDNINDSKKSKQTQPKSMSSPINYPAYWEWNTNWKNCLIFSHPYLVNINIVNTSSNLWDLRDDMDSLLIREASEGFLLIPFLLLCGLWSSDTIRVILSRVGVDVDILDIWLKHIGLPLGLLWIPLFSSFIGDLFPCRKGMLSRICNFT